MTSPVNAIVEELQQLRVRERRHAVTVTALSFAGWGVVALALLWSVAVLNSTRTRLQNETAQLRRVTADARATYRLLSTQAEMYRGQVATLEAQRLQLNITITTLQKEVQNLEGDIGNLSKRRLQAASLLTEYDEPLRKFPTDPILRTFRGYRLYRRGYIREAVHELRRATVLSPSYVWAHYNLALALWAAGDRHGAIAEVAAVFTLDPTFVAIVKADEQFAPFMSEADFRALVVKHAG
jgi:tetratricopeptide (TPR) repeat protein